MSLTIEEMPGRESTTDPPTLKIKFAAEGEWNWSTVASQALLSIPTYASHPSGTLYRQNMTISEIGHALYHITVPYGQQEQAATGAYTLSFDTTGGTVRIFNSKETISKNAASGESAPDYKGLIGVNGDKVEGVDIIIPALKVNVQFKHPSGVITTAQMKTLANATGSVNSDSFLGFSAGEVLFLGATGSAGTDTETTVGYQFAIEANDSALSIGDIADFEKKGHEYVWIAYKDATSSAGGTTYGVKQPQFAYVERVYTTNAFGTVLGFS